jgi:hypothetical protein
MSCADAVFLWNAYRSRNSCILCGNNCREPWRHDQTGLESWPREPAPRRVFNPKQEWL